MAYTYQADVWCDECGKRICEDLTHEGKAPEDPKDEHTYDSDDFPKQYDAEGEESDGPQNCASGNCAGTYGTFLENQLTSDGYKYLKGMLDGHGEVLPDYAREWADFYNFKYHKQEYNGPHDWLDGYITLIMDGARPELVTVARELARALDADAIQDLYQSDMDVDDYFKESGWYSSEMYD